MFYGACGEIFSFVLFPQDPPSLGAVAIVFRVVHSDAPMQRIDSSDNVDPYVSLFTNVFSTEYKELCRHIVLTSIQKSYD